VVAKGEQAAADRSQESSGCPVLDSCSIPAPAPSVFLLHHSPAWHREDIDGTGHIRSDNIVRKAKITS
jgi:hypothetical protein